MLLDSYYKSHIAGQTGQKQCLWNLQKARRQTMRQNVSVADQLSAENLREEFYPRAVLREAEPELLGDEMECKANKFVEGERYWTLVDPVAEEATNKAQSINDQKDSTSIDKENQGLRHRKGLSKEAAYDLKTSKWTTELLEEQEDLIRSADPLSLLGGALPPRDLRTAQQNAKQALQAYIDAANFAMDLIKILNIDDENPETNK